MESNHDSASTNPYVQFLFAGEPVAFLVDTNLTLGRDLHCLSLSKHPCWSRRAEDRYRLSAARLSCRAWWIPVVWVPEPLSSICRTDCSLPPNPLSTVPAVHGEAVGRAPSFQHQPGILGPEAKRIRCIYCLPKEGWISGNRERERESTFGCFLFYWNFLGLPLLLCSFWAFWDRGFLFFCTSSFPAKKHSHLVLSCGYFMSSRSLPISPPLIIMTRMSLAITRISFASLEDYRQEHARRCLVLLW